MLVRYVFITKLKPAGIISFNTTLVALVALLTDALEYAVHAQIAPPEVIYTGCVAEPTVADGFDIYLLDNKVPFSYILFTCKLLKR